LNDPPRPDQIRDIARDLAPGSIVSADFFYFPESINCALPYWAANAFEFVYQIRREFEKPRISMDLSLWIKEVWGPAVANSPAVPHKRLPASCIVSKCVAPLKFESCSGQIEHDVVFAHFVNRSLVTLSRFGTLQTSPIEDDRLGPAVLVSEEPPNDIDVFPCDSGVYVFNRLTQQLKIAGKPDSQVAIESRLFAAVGSSYVFSATGFDIQAPQKQIVRSDTRIVALAGSVTFRILVYATVDGRVHFCTLWKGSVFKILEFAQVFTSILITEKWGFVLLRSREIIEVCNPNGNPIKTVNLKSPIVTWTLCGTRSGFDFVIFADEEKNAGFFEAFYPENQRIVHSAGGLIHASFDVARQRFVFVSGNGKVDLVQSAQTPE
jgi:hypothetical protein